MIIGFKEGTYAITIEDVSSQGRKKPCLCVTVGNEMTKVASFNDENSADYFFEVLEELFNEAMIRKLQR